MLGMQCRNVLPHFTASHPSCTARGPLLVYCLPLMYRPSCTASQVVVTEVAASDEFYLQRVDEPRMAWITEQLRAVALAEGPAIPVRGGGGGEGNRRQ